MSGEFSGSFTKIFYIFYQEGRVKDLFAVSLDYCHTIWTVWRSYSKEHSSSEEYNAMETTAKHNFGLCDVLLPELGQCIYLISDNGHL